MSTMSISAPANAVMASRPRQWIGTALKTGLPTTMMAKLPELEALDPVERLAAVQRGAGRTVAAPQTSADALGLAPREPVNLVVTGTQAELENTLLDAGWTRVRPQSVVNDLKMGVSVVFGWGNDPSGPVSNQYLDGALPTAAFTKNVDHNRGRDHLRIHPLPPDPKTGEARWAIAATRDVAVTLQVAKDPNAGTKAHRKISTDHAIDFSIDGERDQVMSDLLGSGDVSDWSAQRGRRNVPDKVLPSGDVLVGGNYRTDGLVYVLKLGQGTSI